MIPAALDVCGTGFSGIGMLYTSASVWQIMRGSLVVFTSIFSVVFLKKQLYLYNWLAVCTTMTGLGLVGLSAWLDEEDSSKNKNPMTLLFGMGCVVFAQLFTASQMVTEEYFVKDYPPQQVVGCEGVFGMIYMVIILLVMQFAPGTDNGSYENSIDSFYKISHQSALETFVLSYMISIAFFNFMAVSISKYLSAVHRTLVDSCRTALVWVVDLFVYYVISENYGAPWGQHSYLELMGFICVICGTVMYHGILKIPGLYYPPKARDIIVVVEEEMVEDGRKPLVDLEMDEQA